MDLNLNFGKDKTGKDILIDLEKENIHSIFLTGSTGTGKSILHYHLYKQLIKNNSPEELGFVFMDTTRVDFTGWKTPFLYIPVINDSKIAIETLESLVDYVGRKKLFIQIEECDMVIQDVERFEKIWEKIHNNKNIYIVFSTSRPSIEVFTNIVKASTDMIISFHLSSQLDSQWVLGKVGAEELKIPGEKIISYKNIEIFSDGFDEKETEEIRKFDEAMGSVNI